MLDRHKVHDSKINNGKGKAYEEQIHNNNLKSKKKNAVVWDYFHLCMIELEENVKPLAYFFSEGDETPLVYFLKKLKKIKILWIYDKDFF